MQFGPKSGPPPAANSRRRGAPAGRRRKPQIPRSEHQKHLDELCACRAPERRFFRFPFNGPRHHAREASSATRETRSFASRPTSDPKLPSSPSSSLDVPHDSQGSRAQRAVPGARAPRPAAARARARGARRCRARVSRAAPGGRLPRREPARLLRVFAPPRRRGRVRGSRADARGVDFERRDAVRQPRRRRHPPVPVVGRRRGRYRRSRPRRPRRPSRSHAAGRRRRAASRSVRRVRRGDGVARRLPEPRRRRRSRRAGARGGRLPRAPRRGRGVPRPFGPRPETLEGTVVRGGGRGPDRDALRRARGARGGAGRGEARGVPRAAGRAGCVQEARRGGAEEARRSRFVSRRGILRLASDARRRVRGTVRRLGRPPERRQSAVFVSRAPRVASPREHARRAPPRRESRERRLLLPPGARGRRPLLVLPGGRGPVPRRRRRRGRAPGRRVHALLRGQRRVRGRARL